MRITLLLLLCSLAFARAEEPAAHFGWIPSRLLRQGYVQGIKDDQGTRLEILLHTRFMDRVIRSITEKEQNNWGMEHPDTQAYLDTLKAVRERIREDDGHESMLIVWDLTGEIRWFGGNVDDETQPWRMTEPVLLDRIMVGQDYLLRNTALIMKDSLNLSAEAITTFLSTP